MAISKKFSLSDYKIKKRLYSTQINKLNLEKCKIFKTNSWLFGKSFEIKENTKKKVKMWKTKINKTLS